MSVSISTALLTLALTVVLSLGLHAATQALSQVGSAVRTSSAEHARAARTVIQMVSLTATPGGVVVTLRNAGVDPILKVEKMDFLLHATKGTQSRSFWIPNGPAPRAGFWTVQAIAPDTFQPGRWDPGETITITVMLPGDSSDFDPIALTAVTPNGVKAVGILP